MTSTITTALHHALLDPITGAGLLVCPREDDDVPELFDVEPGSDAPVDARPMPAALAPTVNHVDFVEMVRRLRRARPSWHVLMDEDDEEPMVECVLPDGRRVIGLGCDDPINGFDMQSFNDGITELRRILGA